MAHTTTISPFMASLAKFAEYHPQWAQVLLLMEPVETIDAAADGTFTADAKPLLVAGAQKASPSQALAVVAHALLGHRDALLATPDHLKTAFIGITALLEEAIVTRALWRNAGNGVASPKALAPVARTLRAAVEAADTVGALRGLAADTLRTLENDAEALDALAQLTNPRFIGNAPVGFDLSPTIRRTFSSDMDIPFAFKATSDVDDLAGHFHELRAATTPETQLQAITALVDKATTLLDGRTSFAYGVAWSTLIVEVAFVVVLEHTKLTTLFLASESYRAYSRARRNQGLE